MSKISLSKNHGVNPAVPKCFFCGNDKNELVLAGRMKDDAEAPKGAIWDMRPCDECREYMDQGVILISVRDGEMEKVEKDEQRALAEYERLSSWKRRKFAFQYIPDPYRTGGWCVMKDEAIERMIGTPELRQFALQTRWLFVPDEAWDMIGLPRETDDVS